MLFGTSSLRRFEKRLMYVSQDKQILQKINGSSGELDG